MSQRTSQGMIKSGRALPSWAGSLLLLALAVGLRAADFGSPIIHPDEQYYLLLGQHVLAGAVPYVDVWDRGPVGLFLLFAGAAALPGDDIWGYQLLAALFVGLTAIVVAGGARATGASRAGAFAAGVAYLIWVSLLGGRGGQAPVFYNLLIASAARLTLRLPGLVHAPARATVVNGALACLLAGLAIQIRETAAIEAVFFAVAHVWWLRRGGARAGTTIGAGVLWLAVAVAPTVGVALTYRALGPVAFNAWWFANTVSIFARIDDPASEIAMRLLGIVAQLSPLLLCAGLAWRRRRLRLTGERGLAFGWLGAALAGFVVVGTYFDQHALPLVAPLAMIAGLALGRIPRVLVGTLVLGFLLMIVERAFIPHDATAAREVARVVRANSRGGCPYVFSGDTATYSLAGACLPTAYAFSGFLAYTTYAGAIPVDATAEVGRILDKRPPVIVASTPRLTHWNTATVALLKTTLGRDYRAVFSAHRAKYRTVVFLRNDLPFIAR